MGPPSICSQSMYHLEISKANYFGEDINNSHLCFYVYARITLRGRQGKYKLIKTLRHSELKYTAKSGTLYSIFKVSPY